MDHSKLRKGLEVPKTDKVFKQYNESVKEQGAHSVDSWYLAGYYVGLMGNFQYRPLEQHVPSEECLAAWTLGRDDGLGERSSDH